MQLLNGIEGQTGQYLQQVHSQLMGVQGFISELAAAQHEAIKGCRAEVAALSEGIEAKIEKLWKHFFSMDDAVKANDQRLTTDSKRVNETLDEQNGAICEQYDSIDELRKKCVTLETAVLEAKQQLQTWAHELAGLQASTKRDRTIFTENGRLVQENNQKIGEVLATLARVEAQVSQGFQNVSTETDKKIEGVRVQLHSLPSSSSAGANPFFEQRLAELESKFFALEQKDFHSSVAPVQNFDAQGVQRRMDILARGLDSLSAKLALLGANAVAVPTGSSNHGAPAAPVPTATASASYLGGVPPEKIAPERPVTATDPPPPHVLHKGVLGGCNSRDPPHFRPNFDRMK